MSIRDSSGVITNYHIGGQNSVWYETTETDEVIFFSDKEGNRRIVNDYIIFANTTDLLVQLIRTYTPREPVSDEVVYLSDVIPIQAGDSWANGKHEIHGIKILGDIGQQVRYIANYY